MALPLSLSLSLSLPAGRRKRLCVCAFLSAVGLIILFCHPSSIFYTSSGADCVSMDMTQCFLEACREVGLNVILMDGDVVRKEGQGTQMPHLDQHGQHAATFGAFVTFGVIDPPKNVLDKLSQVFGDRTKLSLHKIHDVDPRNVLASSFVHNRNLATIPLHFLWWAPVKDFGGELRIHLVIFRSRAGYYLWHGELFPSSENDTAGRREDRRRKLPFRMPRDSIGQYAALIDRFTIREDTVGGLSVSVPANMTAFRLSLRDGLIAECNHTTAKRLVTRYGASKAYDPRFRKRVLKTLNITANTLDRLGLPFWLSSGTFLGWYRQCDVVPYTKDIDIEMRIEDYTPKMTEALVAAGLKQLKQIGKVSDNFQVRFGRSHSLQIDIFFRYEEQDHFWWGMFNSWQKYRYVFPKYSLRWAEFGGLRVRVPYPPELYLTTLYGQEWAEPIEDWHWLFGPHNKVQVDFWSKKDLPEVYIDF